MSQTGNRYEYEVFTRINRGDDLMHVGTVEAQTDEMAQVYATFIYNEEDWAEMCLVRRDNISWTKQPDALFGKEGAVHYE